MFKIEPRYKIRSVGIKELLYKYKFHKYGDKLVIQWKNLDSGRIHNLR